MEKTKKILAGIMAVAMAATFAACGDSGSSSPAPSNNGGGDDGAQETEETTTVSLAPVEDATTATLASEAQEQLSGAASRLRDVELENKTVKWFAHYDENPAEGSTVPVRLAMFQEKYGGQLQWYPTTWAQRYDDLSTYVLGGEGIDLFPCDDMALPKGVISGMFQPIDDYADLSSDIWQSVNAAVERFNFNGKHYCLATGVSANNVVLYNHQTIEENGFDDPWELYEKGEWNWDTFKSMLQEFCDQGDDYYGLDGWWSELGLYRSGGKAFIEVVDGEIVMNMFDPDIERAQDFMLDLYNCGLVFDKSQFDWAEQIHYMGEGQELFLIVGSWGAMHTPDDNPNGIPGEQLGMVPVPNPAGMDHPWTDAVINGNCIVKGAANPEGAVLYAECAIVAGDDEEARKVEEDKYRNDFKWNEDVIEHLRLINQNARDYPIVDICGGMSSDVESLTTSNQNKSVGLNASLHGVPWSQTRDELSGALDVLVGEVIDKLKAAQAEG